MSSVQPIDLNYTTGVPKDAVEQLMTLISVE